MHELNEWIEPLRIAAAVGGELYLLGIGSKLGMAQRALGLGATLPPTGIGKDEILFLVDEQGQVLRREAAIDIPTTAEGMKSLRGKLAQTPFLVDSSGNKYFQMEEGQLSWVTAAAGIRQIPIPPSGKADVQFISNLVSRSEPRVKVVVVEGSNLQREDRRQAGMFLLEDPVQRVFWFEPLYGLTEVASERRLPYLIGALSDGRSVWATHGRGKIGIRVTAEGFVRRHTQHPSVRVAHN